MGDLIPHGLGFRQHGAVEGRDLVGARAASGAELESALGQVVHRRGALGQADRMLFGRGERRDGRAEVDSVGLRRYVPHEGIGGGHVAVLGEAVVFAAPGVFPVVFVGVDGVFGFTHEHQMLGFGVVRGRAGQVPVEEEAKLHCVFS